MLPPEGSEDQVIDFAIKGVAALAFVAIYALFDVSEGYLLDPPNKTRAAAAKRDEFFLLKIGVRHVEEGWCRACVLGLRSYRVTAWQP